MQSKRAGAGKGSVEARIAESRARIIELALTLFMDRGFDSVSMTEIAEAAGISRRSLFRYSTSKDDIVFASVDQLEGAFMRRKLAADDGPADPMARLRWAYRALAEEEETQMEAARIKTRLIFDTPALARRMHQGLDDWQREFTDLLSPGNAGGGEPAFRSRAQVAAVTALYITAVRQWADDDSRTLLEWIDAAFAVLD